MSSLDTDCAMIKTYQTSTSVVFFSCTLIKFCHILQHGEWVFNVDTYQNILCFSLFSCNIINIKQFCMHNGFGGTEINAANTRPYLSR